MQRFWARDLNRAQPSTSLSSPYQSFGGGNKRSSDFYGAQVKDDAKKIVPNNGSSSSSNNSSSESINGVDEGSWVLMPVLQSAEPCTRCGLIFQTENNSSNACVFHADSDGNLGEYKQFYIKEEGSSVREVHMWNCCGASRIDARGCSSRPHCCKVLMLSIRANANPSARIQNVEMSVITALEISIFPGASYDLQVKISRSLVSMVHKYFSIDEAEIARANIAEEESESLLAKKSRRRGAVTTSRNNLSPGAVGISNRSRSNTALSSSSSNNLLSLTDESVSSSFAGDDIGDSPLSLSSSNSSSTSTSKKFKVASIFSSLRKISGRSGDKNKSSGGMESADGSVDSSNNTSDIRSVVSRRGIGSVTGSSASSSLTASNNSVSTGGADNTRQEGLYINYLRVGDVYVDVTTTGFPLNLTKYRAVVESFFCRGEVMDWHALFLKIERHARWSLTKHTASNSLTKLSNFFSWKSSSMLPRISNTSSSSSINLRDDSLNRESRAGASRFGDDFEEDTTVTVTPREHSEKVAKLLGISPKK